MRNAATPQRASEDVLPQEGSRELATALSHGLNLPLSALRASMEALSSELGELPGQHVLTGALEEVERLGRNVRDLVDYAKVEVPAPLPCTVDEIVRSARNGLPRDVRSRVLLARTPSAYELVVDGPILGRALRRLIDNALEAGSDTVLVLARQDSRHTTFTVIDGAAGAFDPQWAEEPFHSTKPNHMGLGLTLTRRDVVLLDGQLELRVGADRRTRAVVTVPNEANTPTGFEFRDRFAPESGA